MNDAVMQKEIPTRELIDLIRRAGKLICAVEAGAEHKKVSSKEGHANFVTAYDVQVQAFLEEGMRALMPDVSFLAEENGEDGNAIGAGRTFILDPIDGTTNFIRDHRCSVISAGLVENGIPIWAAVYQPYTDELFWAARGQGAYLNGKRISVTQKAFPDALTMVGTSPYAREELGEQTARLMTALFLKTADLRRSGSAALDLCCLACGRADCFFELRLAPWDYAAAALILEEAGGRIADLNGHPLQFARKSSVLAGNASSFKDLLETAQAVLL